MTTDLGVLRINELQDLILGACEFHTDEDCERCKCECPVDYAIYQLEKLMRRINDGEV